MKRTWKFLILCFGVLVVVILSCLISAKLDYIKQRDLDKNGIININDVCIFADNWLNEKGN